MRRSRRSWWSGPPGTGSATTEARGTVSFTVALASPPTADVTIPVSSSDLTEGTVSTPSLTFTPANWNVPQTVTVTGVDDAIIDGDVAYTTVLGAASSADPAYEGRDPVDVPVVNVDDDVPPTKFYVVNDASTDRTCEYAATGLSVENYALDGGDTAPRGAASTAAGDKVWVVDANKNAYVYSTSGVLLGSWTAGSLATNATVVGIAINGAASRLSGRPGHSLARHRADPHRRETYEDLAPVLLTPTVASCLALRPRRRPSFAGVLPASPPAC